MGIDGFNEIISIVSLAKELYDLNRFDIVKKHFFDSLCYDSCFENMLGCIESIFSNYYSNYDDRNELERMIFSDDVISDYFCIASEYGQKNKIRHNENPYVKEAEFVIQRWLNFSYSLDWNLLSYTKSKSTAYKSKIIIEIYTCEFYEYYNLAYGLIQIYKWFSDKSAEFIKQKEVAA